MSVTLFYMKLIMEFFIFIFNPIDINAEEGSIGFLNEILTFNISLFNIKFEYDILKFLF